MDKDTKATIYFMARRRDVGIAYMLALLGFLGLFGAHRFYLGRKGTAIIMLILSLIGTGLMFVGLLVVGLTLLGLTAFGLALFGGAEFDFNAFDPAPSAPMTLDPIISDPINYGLVVLVVMICCLVITTVWLIVDLFLIPGMARSCNRALMKEAQEGVTL